MALDPQTLQPRLERIEKSIERWRRKPASRRQRLILAGYRRAASELRRQVASLENYPASSEVVVLDAGDQPPAIGTCTPSAPCRVFRVIRNPAAGTLTRNRRLTRAALRVVK
jgi:hypothetical protein